MSEDNRALYYRHARYYLDRLSSLEHKVDGEEQLKQEAVSLFVAEWPQISAAQRWAASHAAEDVEAAELCWQFGSLDSLFGRGWIPKMIALRWAEDALNAATQRGKPEHRTESHWILGCLLRDMGRIEEGIDHFKECYNMTAWESARRGRSAVMIADCFLMSNNRKEAENWLQLAEGGSAGADHLHSRRAMVLAELAERDHDYEEAIARYTDAANYAREDGCSHCESLAHYYRAKALMAIERRGDVVEALSKSMECLFDGKLLNNFSVIADALRHSAKTPEERHRAIASLQRIDEFLPSFQLCDYENNIVAKIVKIKAECWLALACLHSVTHNYDKCERYLYSLLEQIPSRDEFQSHVAQGNLLLGLVSLSRGQTTDAMFRYLTALKIASGKKLPGLCALICMQIGELVEIGDDLPLARDWFLEAIKYQSEHDHFFSQIERHCMLGVARNSSDAAEKRLGAIAKQLENAAKDVRLLHSRDLAKLYLKLGRYHASLRYLYLAIRYDCAKKNENSLRQDILVLLRLIEKATLDMFEPDLFDSFNSEVTQLTTVLFQQIKMPNQLTDNWLSETDSLLRNFLQRIGQLFPITWDPLLTTGKPDTYSPPTEDPSHQPEA